MLGLDEVGADLQKLAPHSLDAERAVLGGLLLDHQQIVEISEIIKKDDFYRSWHKKLFELLKTKSEKNSPVDILTVSEHILSSDSADLYGGIAYVSSLPEQVPATENLSYYAQIIKAKSTRRRLIESCRLIMEQSQSGSITEENLIGLAEKEILNIASFQNQKKSFVSLQDSITEEYQSLIKNYEEGIQPGIATGYTELDKYLNGLHRGDLLILAARPAMGKTSLAMGIAHNISKRMPVGFFSLEMSRKQLTQRILSTQGKIPLTKFRSNNLTMTDLSRLEEAADELWSCKIIIDDDADKTISTLRSCARRMKAQNPDLGLIVLDYIQLVSSGEHGSGFNRENQVSMISRGLKIMAKELDVPVVALSQLNRSVESREDKRPLLSDLRESGALEQDADVILFIYRDEYYNPDTRDRGIAEVLISKQRNGPLGTAKLGFKGEYTEFHNLNGERL